VEEEEDGALQSVGACTAQSMKVTALLVPGALHFLDLHLGLQVWVGLHSRCKQTKITFSVLYSSRRGGGLIEIGQRGDEIVGGGEKPLQSARLIMHRGSWALITGANTGIGKETARRLIEQGIDMIFSLLLKPRRFLL